MRFPRSRITVGKLMIAIGIVAVILGIAPVCFRFCYDAWWTWSVLRDVERGQSTRYSAEGFVKVGPRSVQALREALKGNRSQTRQTAAQSLGRILQDVRPAVRNLARPAIPDLAAALHDPDRDVRMCVVIAVKQAGPDAGEAVGPLIELLRHEDDPQMVAVAVEALGRIGPQARPAVPVLASFANDPRHSARILSALAMWRIGPARRAECRVVLPVLIDQLSTGSSPRERAWAAEVLAEMAPIAHEALPALIAATRDQDKRVGRAAQAAIEAIPGASLQSQEDRPISPQVGP